MSIDATDLRYAIEAVGTTQAELATVSHVGTVRSENQDRSGWVAVPGGVAIVLADGMGGGVGGGEAAAAAVGAILPTLTAGGTLQEAVAAASAAVSSVRSSFGGGMVGTTVVVASIRPGSVSVANVGDSRAYICGADGGIRRITTDHSRAGELVAAGTLSEAAARRDGRRNMLTRAVNGDPVVADIFDVDLASADTVALCSDGVWEPLEDAVLARLWGAPDLGAGVLASCRAALDAGSRDNVTVVAARTAHA